MHNAFFANFDLASLAIWLFWIFFALLVFHLQRENMREGYPLEDDDGRTAANQGPFPVPQDKSFILPHGRGTLSVPSGQKSERRHLALRKTAAGNGFPFEPTGNPMTDGVGPASWALRRDWPELDARGHPKIVPLRSAPDFFVSAGADPRGMPVISGDKKRVGTVSDMWIDEPEQLVRYLEVDLDSGAGKRLVPMGMARIWFGKALVQSIYANHFDSVPVTTSPERITLLEEERICAYFGGGYLYASKHRFEPQI